VRRDYRASAGRRTAALVGILLGFGLLAAVAFALVGGRDEDEGPVGPETQANAAGTGETEPPKPILRIVFPEGFTRKDMAKRITAVNRIAEDRRGITPSLAAKAYLRASKRLRNLPADFDRLKAPHLEGFLFPATYEFTEDTSSRELVGQQLDAFTRAWRQVDMKYARSKKLTPYDVLVIASMVEGEVQVPRERPLVAAVIYNRLRIGMPLQIDATIRYGLDIPPTEAIRQSQLDSDNPYNTRKFAGLPPTPIGNPGLASLQAAAHPAEVDFIYFVRKADCRSHFFTASEQEFLDYPRAGLQC
jgi:UPF0755 protein